MAGDPWPSIVCPECAMESWHPKDVEEGYCGRCHWWTGDPILYAAWKADRAEQGIHSASPGSGRETRSTGAVG
ncbi:hypothetical protein ACFC0S_15760 [Streptomyces sp. NPDC056084]|uniref:hypothetical protein n=1 Tax=unclassified Streptomyces TaxID=2593676 RepID=UPI0035DC5BA7